jgi:hypothetical protein
MKINKRRFFGFMLLSVSSFVYPQESGDNTIENEYADFGANEGITIYGETVNPDEDYILEHLNSFVSKRKRFIENELLDDAGFRRTGNIRFRKSTGSEKALSVLHGVAHTFSFGIVPIKPFLEVEYGKLPKGEYYPFETVIYSSKYRDYSPDILRAMELEYKLQIEFGNGILYSDNMHYYSEENIKKFEELALMLPDTIENFRKLKDRYLNEELPRIRRALERQKSTKIQAMAAGGQAASV